MSCVYCELSEIKARAIAGDDLAWAFPTNIPIVPGHLLIVPRRCVRTMDELTAAELEAMLRLAGKLKAALRAEFQADGFNCAWNEGEVAGQNVPHLHWHLLPRRAGDEGITEYEPRKFLYRPGSRETTPEAELRDIAARLRARL